VIRGLSVTEKSSLMNESEREVPMRIAVLNPLPGVAMCVRRKDDELVGRAVSTGDDLSFNFVMRAKRVDGHDAPRLLGPFAFGPPAQRFVYIRVGTLVGQKEVCWTRRRRYHSPASRGRRSSEPGEDRFGWRHGSVAVPRMAARCVPLFRCSTGVGA
jgi:hypothetical protein